jgi:hypothetical protein
MAGKQSKKSKKHGREARHPAHLRYNAGHRRLARKAANIVRFMRKHPGYKLPENADEEVKSRVYTLLK